MEDARESRSLKVFTLELLGVATTIPWGCGRGFFFFDEGITKGGWAGGGGGEGEGGEKIRVKRFHAETITFLLVL